MATIPKRLQTEAERIRDQAANVTVEDTAPPDSVSFAESLGFNPDEWQRRLLSSASDRILLNCCRQSGKSTTAAVLALHQAMFTHDSLVLLVSPSLRQSSELFRKVSGFMYALNERPHLVEENKLSATFANGSRIVSLPSKEETIRGFSGADLIIEDEAARVSDGLYRTIRPMLAVSGGRLILMSTPFGKRGHFFEEWTNGEGWQRFEISGHDCPRISGEFLEDERRSLGPWWFQQEYLCVFSETVDQLFSYESVDAAFSDEIEPLFAEGVATT